VRFSVNGVETELIPGEMEEDFIPFRPFQIYYEDLNSFLTVNDGVQWKAKVSVPRDLASNIFTLLNSISSSKNIQVYGFKKIADGTYINILKLSAPVFSESVLDEEWGWSFEVEERYPSNRYLPLPGSGSIIKVELIEQALEMYIPAIEFDELLQEKRFVFEYEDNSSEEELEAVIPVIQIEFNSLLKGEFLKAIIKERLAAGTLKLTVTGSQFFSTQKTVRCLEEVDFKRHQKIGYSTYSGVLHFILIDALTDVTIDTDLIDTF